MTDEASIPASQPYTVWFDHPVPGHTMFVNFSAVKPSWGYRGCGVFSCPSQDREANIEALRKNGRLVIQRGRP
jgi:hypothetical protein